MQQLVIHPLYNHVNNCFFQLMQDFGRSSIAISYVSIEGPNKY